MSFFLLLFKVTIIQLLGLLGLFLVFGFALSKLQEWTQKNYQQSVGWKGILWTAWLGTPIHEFGHIVFAKIFGHKITRIALFQPDEASGELGAVDHAYKKYNLWQRLGNFFIGAAPMIFGSFFLVVLLYLLLPNGKEIFSPLANNTTSFSAFFIGLKQALVNLFSLGNLKAWNFWIFLYISFAISSHLAPSKQDRKGMWNGLVLIIIILIIANAIALLLHRDITAYVLQVNKYLAIFIAIFAYASILSFLHWFFSVIFLTPFRKR